ncbi:MAG: hypothetical protein M0Q12_02700 [Synergistaceae bacterium]|jgi:hypothetical protein|nr:hypothetical protein [Synergistaceae bacterium]
MTEDLIKYCRYYKGEKECPESIKAKEASSSWFYEKLWVERDELRAEKGYNTTGYIQYSMQDFNADDGFPITLNALLFNRHCHWSGYGMENDKKQFIEWYLKHYLGKK